MGGWCPPGRESESGWIPDDLPLRETPTERSADAPDVPRSLRTEWNVRDSDATLLLHPAGAPTDPGTEWTMRAASRYGRPLLACDPAADDAAARIAAWIERVNPVTLNVAGPSEAAYPGIAAMTRQVLVAAFSGLAR